MRVTGNPFHGISVFLVGKFRLDQLGKGNRELHQELVSLEGGRRSAVREYYIRKTEMVLLTVVAGSLAAAAGTVERIYVSEGQQVKAGEMVAKLK